MTRPVQNVHCMFCAADPLPLAHLCPGEPSIESVHWTVARMPVRLLKGLISLKASAGLRAQMGTTTGLRTNNNSCNFGQATHTQGRGELGLHTNWLQL